MDLEKRIDIVVNRIEAAVQEYNIKAVYALCSGGDDSVVTAYLASHHPKFKGIIFANTLTGDKETIDYVRNLAPTMGWHYDETKPAINARYPAFIATYGIPTPAMHPYMFNNLKGKPFEKIRTTLAKRHKCKRQEIMYVSGVRKSESSKREKTVQPVTVMETKSGKVKSVWGAPIWDYRRDDLEDVFSQARDLERNQHAYKFGASRECGCKSTESLTDIIIEREHYEVYAKRRALQYELARAAYALQQFELEYGLIDQDDAKIPSYALESHADKSIDNQKMLFPYRYDSPDSVDGVPFLCVGCENQIGEDPDQALWAAKQHSKKEDDAA